MKVDLAGARDRVIPDVLPAEGDPLRVLFCGINPGLYSAATGWHFARPGNRFWPALYQSGFTDRQLHPSEQAELARFGLGITNIAPRATAQAAELTDAELRAGADRLRALIADRRPSYVAIAGVTAYRAAFARPRAAIGPQEDRLGAARLWILPNPSGLNAQWTVPRITTAFRELREAVERQAEMRIGVFLHGTAIMHAAAATVEREERVRQVRDRDAIVRDFASYVPTPGTAAKLAAWQRHGVSITYLSSHRTMDDLSADESVIRGHGFPSGPLHGRQPGEDYGSLVARLGLDVLVEDDCESIGGAAQTCAAQLSAGTAQATRCLVLPEFAGLAGLPDDPAQLL
jgi:TDG/mug DNA glycosylase family protein